MSAKLLLKLTACLLVAGLGHSASCDLPSYLKSVVWETTIKNSRLDTMKYIQFVDDRMQLTDFSGEDPVTETKSCVRHIHGNKFLFQGSELNQNSYFCMEFIKRSDHVIQLRKSVRNGLNNTNLCNDAFMTLDPWPLVWNDLEGESFERCPLEGGFNVNIWDNKVLETTCDGLDVKPRLESDCLEGEGMVFDFRSPECKPETPLHMALKQKLRCLGSWKSAEFNHVIVSDGDEMMPKLWMMSYKEDNIARMEVYLTTDLNTDLESSVVNNPNYFRLTLRRQLFPSLCEDEAENCAELNDACSGARAQVCRRFCGLCQDTQFDRCQFSDIYRGEWLESTSAGLRDVRITRSMLYHEEQSNYECQNIQVAKLYEGMSRHTMATIFRNGCKPRFTCVEMSRRTSSVMQYRLSRSASWPLDDEELGPEGVCHHSFFAKTNEDVYAMYPEMPSRNLVAKPNRGQSRQSVDCKFPGKYQLMTYYPNGNTCNGTLSTSCKNDDVLTMQLEAGCAVQTVHQFRCLASFNEHTKNFIITESLNNDNELTCWIHEEDVYDTFENKLYLLNAADCNKAAPIDIEFRNSQKYIAKFDFKDVKTDLPECDSSQPRTPPLTTTTTSKATPTTSSASSQRSSTTRTQPTTLAAILRSQWNDSLKTNTRSPDLELNDALSSESPSSSAPVWFENGPQKDAVGDIVKWTTSASSDRIKIAPILGFISTIVLCSMHM